MGDINISELLLKNGADPHKTDENKNNFLFFAYRKNNLEYVQYFLKNYQIKISTLKEKQ